MTSKAERKRKKRAARRIVGSSARAAAVSHDVAAQAAEPKAEEPAAKGQGGGLSELQEAAWRWFYAKVTSADAGGAGSAEARAELALVRPHLAVEEYAALCEACRTPMDAARRIGRSRQSTYALLLSALRKIVIYRSMAAA